MREIPSLPNPWPAKQESVLSGFSLTRRGWIASGLLLFAALSLLLVLGDFPFALALTVGLALAYLVYGISQRIREESVDRLRLADWVTLSRPILLASAILAAGFRSGAASIVAAIVLVGLAFLSDLVDGLVARRSPKPLRPFGAWLDAEADSVGFILLSVGLFYLGRPGWVLLFGLARYGFGALFAIVPTEPRFPRWFSLAAKSVSAFVQVYFFAAWLFVLGGLPPELRSAVDLPTVELGLLALLGLSFLVELGFRAQVLGRLLAGSGARGISGLAVSFVVYHLLPLRQKGMRRMYGRFLEPGDLVFDVGSHLGNRIRAFRSLGARVVAFEPQAACVRLLEHWFGDDGDLTIRSAALGPKAGKMELLADPNHPTLATLSKNWTEQMATKTAFRSVSWSPAIQVEVETLDEQIGRYGTPAFVKIDVEGFEADVLRGLSVPVPALSFEFLSDAPENALACMDQIRRLGSYEFNYSIVETMRFVLPDWVDQSAMEAEIRQLAAGGPSGDIYARLKSNE